MGQKLVEILLPFGSLNDRLGARHLAQTLQKSDEQTFRARL
jgi:hypothetical protein